MQPGGSGALRSAEDGVSKGEVRYLEGNQVPRLAVQKSGKICIEEGEVKHVDGDGGGQRVEGLKH